MTYTVIPSFQLLTYFYVSFHFVYVFKVSCGLCLSGHRNLECSNPMTSQKHPCSALQCLAVPFDVPFDLKVSKTAILHFAVCLVCCAQGPVSAPSPFVLPLFPFAVCGSFQDIQVADALEKQVPGACPAGPGRALQGFCTSIRDASHKS